QPKRTAAHSSALLPPSEDSTVTTSNACPEQPPPHGLLPKPHTLHPDPRRAEPEPAPDPPPAPHEPTPQHLAPGQCAASTPNEPTRLPPARATPRSRMQGTHPCVYQGGWTVVDGRI